MPGMIVVFHTPSNAGYAMAPLEKMFYDVACDLCGNADEVHFAFRSLDAGMPESLPQTFRNVIALDPDSPESQEFNRAMEYIKDNNIEIALCFDLQPSGILCGMLRRSGVKTLISYWGSTISSRNYGVKLWIKRIEVLLTRNKPNLFIFESESMREYAVYGRGINKNDTCVIPTGVNTEKFKPDSEGKEYLERQFNIGRERVVCFYSGHMEKRKGVDVIVNTAIELIDTRGVSQVSFLICGNRPGEEQQFLKMLDGKKAAKHVIFAGYRKDIDKLISGCDIGIIASTGWDSFPMSSLEMASGGMPIVVSALQGLNETVENGITGFSFPPGDHASAADFIQKLVESPNLRKRMSNAARQRIVSGYSLAHQKASLLKSISEVLDR